MICVEVLSCAPRLCPEPMAFPGFASGRDHTNAGLAGYIHTIYFHNVIFIFLVTRVQHLTVCPQARAITNRGYENYYGCPATLIMCYTKPFVAFLSRPTPLHDVDRGGGAISFGWSLQRQRSAASQPH